MRVYRVMDKMGRGPYTYLCSEDWQDLDRPPSDDEHPVPWDDGITRVSSAYVCGFASLSQLHAWFSDDELDRLAYLGFAIHEIYVSDEHVKLGKHQVMFDRNEVEDYSLAQLERAA